MAVSKAAPKKKIKKVKKAAQKKSVDKAKRKADSASIEDAAAAKARNPKAFVFSGRGKAKLQQARSAERDQKRMHGTSHSPATFGHVEPRAKACKHSSKMSYFTFLFFWLIRQSCTYCQVHDIVCTVKMVALYDT